MKIVKVIIGLTLISCHNSTADATGVYYLRNLGFNTPKFCKLLIKKY